MRILVIHNQLWAHYKSILFEEIFNDLNLNYPGSEFLVAHIGLFEKSREGMGTGLQKIPFNYPYQVLFPRSLDSITLKDRIKAVFEVFNTFKPEVLNITGYFDWAQVLLMFYAKWKGIKVVISSESSPIDKTRSALKENFKKFIVRQADAFFCFGTTSVDYLKSLGIPLSRICVKKAAVVDNDRISKEFQAAFLKKFKTAGTGRNFIYVGRLSPEKNLLTLLKAYKEVSESYEFGSEWGMILVGQGPYRKQLEDFTHENNLRGVKFTGGVSWEEVPGWLAQADVLILPSYSEPWGLVVNEALVCGMPVLVSNKCGCAKDLVQSNQNGFIFDPYNLDELVQGMQFCVHSADKLSEMGEHSKRIIAAFTPKKVAKEMNKCYHSMLNRTNQNENS